MATCPQNKISADIAADRCSVDSLSFAGLVCIQDQQSNFSPPTNNTKQISKQDPEFEFSCGALDLNAHKSNKNQSTDLLINQPCSKSLSKASRSDGKRSSDDNTKCLKTPDKPCHKVKNQNYKQNTRKRSWFGQKTFESFVCPCRERHAIKPAVK